MFQIFAAFADFAFLVPPPMLGQLRAPDHGFAGIDWDKNTLPTTSPMPPKQHRHHSPLGLTRSLTTKLSNLIKLPPWLKKLRAQVQKPVVRPVEDESAVTPEVDSEAIERSILAALEIQSSPSMRIDFTAIRALIVAYSSLSIPTPE